jgi:hypothetical protein
VGQGNDAAPTDGDTCFHGFPVPTGEDVLYRWTAPSNGTFVFNTLSSATDTVVYLWPQCGGPDLVCNDDFDDFTHHVGSLVGLQMTTGQQVIVAVDSYDTSGPFTLNIKGPVAPGNCCAARGTAGCQDTAVQACVCDPDVDPYCCGTAWDENCVEEAISICSAVCY